MKFQPNTFSEKKINRNTKEQLYIAQEETYLPLPEWAKFYIELGNEIAQFQNHGKRIVVATAIPVRNYAVVFTALGIILNRGNQLINNQNKFDYLCNLPIDSPLLFYNKNKRKKAKYKGTGYDYYGNKCLMIQVENSKSGGLTQSVSIDEAKQVSLGKTNKKLPKRQKGYQIKDNNSFLKKILHPKDVNQFLSNSQLDCALIGNRNLLKSEINETFLYKDKMSGNFQDILRVRNLFSTDQPYHSEIFSDRKQPNLSEYSKPFITIFDGALGFIKCRDYFRDSHWIVLLDRTEHKFLDAVDILNQDYMGRVSEEKLEKLSSIPLGVETLVYQEKI